MGRKGSSSLPGGHHHGGRDLHNAGKGWRTSPRLTGTYPALDREFSAYSCGSLSTSCFIMDMEQLLARPLLKAPYAKGSTHGTYKLLQMASTKSQISKEQKIITQLCCHWWTEIKREKPPLPAQAGHSGRKKRQPGRQVLTHGPSPRSKVLSDILRKEK